MITNYFLLDIDRYRNSKKGLWLFLYIVDYKVKSTPPRSFSYILPSIFIHLYSEITADRACIAIKIPDNNFLQLITVNEVKNLRDKTMLWLHNKKTTLISKLIAGL